MLRYTYIACLVVCNFFIPVLIHSASFDDLAAFIKAKGFSEVTSFGEGQIIEISLNP
jgi:hypothetical protein